MLFYFLLGAVFVFSTVCWHIFKNINQHQQTEKEIGLLISAWHPEPLVPETPQNHPALRMKYVEGKVGKYLNIGGKQYLNLATSNFLGLVGDKRIEVAKDTVFKYGVGTCGPRAFYGTIDVHLALETQLADFMGCESALLYSDGFTAITSAIAAYAKKGDVIFCDKESLLILQTEKDKKNPRVAKVTRRFLIVEGIYINSGQICRLPQLLALKWTYKVRIFIDESISFGVLGMHGRGVTQYFNVDVKDVDLICARLENAVASTGGFCCGTSYVVDHQRLAGLGYCFSNSAPPLLVAAATEALRIISTEPDRLKRLQKNSIQLLDGLKKLLKKTKFKVDGMNGSPVMHIRYNCGRNEEAETKLDALVQRMFNRQIATTRARYLTSHEAFVPEPSIRLAVSSELCEMELAGAMKQLAQVVKEL